MEKIKLQRRLCWCFHRNCQFECARVCYPSCCCVGVGTPSQFRLYIATNSPQTPRTPCPGRCPSHMMAHLACRNVSGTRSHAQDFFGCVLFFLLSFASILSCVRSPLSHTTVPCTHKLVSRFLLNLHRCSAGRQAKAKLVRRGELDPQMRHAHPTPSRTVRMREMSPPP